MGFLIQGDETTATTPSLEVKCPLLAMNWFSSVKNKAFSMRVCLKQNSCLSATFFFNLFFFFSCCLVKHVRLLSCLSYSCLLIDGCFLPSLHTMFLSGRKARKITKLGKKAIKLLNQERKQKMVLWQCSLRPVIKSGPCYEEAMQYPCTRVSLKACNHDRKRENTGHAQGHNRKKKKKICGKVRISTQILCIFITSVTKETKSDSKAPKFS